MMHLQRHRFLPWLLILARKIALYIILWEKGIDTQLQSTGLPERQANILEKESSSIVKISEFRYEHSYERFCKISR